MFQQLPEATRLAYLEAMGVESFFPRIELPGAPPAALCQTLPEPAAAEQLSPAVGVPLAGQPEAQGAPVTGLDREALLKELKPREVAPSAPAAKPTAAPESSAEKIQFTLRFYQVAGLAMIVDSSPMATPESAILRFSANLLLALSRQVADWEGSIKENLHQHLFRWPLVGNAQVATDAAAAREAVSAAVVGNCERAAISRILLLGETAARFAAIDQPNCRVVSGESVAHYLQNPLAKRGLWQSLQAWR